MPRTLDEHKHILLLNNSIQFGLSYLDHAERDSRVLMAIMVHVGYSPRTITLVGSLTELFQTRQEHEMDSTWRIVMRIHSCVQYATEDWRGAREAKITGKGDRGHRG